MITIEYNKENPLENFPLPPATENMALDEASLKICLQICDCSIEKLIPPDGGGEASARDEYCKMMQKRKPRDRRTVYLVVPA